MKNIIQWKEKRDKMIRTKKTFKKCYFYNKRMNITKKHKVLKRK